MYILEIKGTNELSLHCFSGSGSEEPKDKKMLPTTWTRAGKAEMPQSLLGGGCFEDFQKVHPY